MTIVFLVLALGILSFLMIAVVFLADLISVWSSRHLHYFHVAPWLPFLEVPSSPSSMTIVFLGCRNLLLLALIMHVATHMSRSV